jgi:serine/threonine protein kinase
MGDHVDQQLGNYQLQRLIGQGSVAHVYLGEHVHLHTQVAVKVLQLKLDENNAADFLDKASMIAHLVHPCILRLIDFGVQDTIPFLVMDYAPHGTLRQRFLRGKPLPRGPLATYIKQAAAALQHGHNHNLLHRAVKPENMLIGSNGEILLADIGQTTLIQHFGMYAATEMVGNAAYMAPEQLQGQTYPVSDQYALAVVAYEWLTGNCPFQGTSFEIASQQVNGSTPSLRERVPDIPIQIEKVIMKALNKDPRQRFPSVKDFSLALEEACLISHQHAFRPASKRLSRPLFPPVNASGPLLMSGSGQAPIGFSGNHPINSLSPSSPAGPNSMDGLSSMGSSSVRPQQSFAQNSPAGPRSMNGLSPMASSGVRPMDGLTPLETTPVNPHSMASISVADNIIQRYSSSTDTKTEQPKEQPNLVQPRPAAAKTPFTAHTKNLNTIRIIFISAIILIAFTGVYELFSLTNIGRPTTDATSTNIAQSNQNSGQNQKSMQKPITKTPTPVQEKNPYATSGTLVLDNPLADGKGIWQKGAIIANGGTCAQTAGTGYVVTAPIIDPGECIEQQHTFTNFTYEVTMKFTAIRQRYSGGGITFRSSSDGSQYYYFELFQSGYYTLQVCNAGDCTKTLDGYKLNKPAITAFNAGLGATNVLAVVANNNAFAIFVNKQQVVNVTDNTYTQGHIGVMATGGNNQGLRTAPTSTPTTAVFSNAKVWTLP